MYQTRPAFKPADRCRAVYEAEIKFVAQAPLAPPGTPLPDAVYDDSYFDTPGGAFYASGRELRLRLTGGRAVLTMKTPPFDAATASKEEFETDVADPAAMRAILAGLGYVERLRYAKRCRRSRDVWRGLPLAVAVVTVDFDARTFVEIEHPADDREAALAALPVIRDYAAHLGLARECPDCYTDLFLASRTGQSPQPPAAT